MRALVAMSGGVDSSVAARLTLEQGYDIVGVTLLMHGGDSENDAVRDARAVCDALGARHEVWDVRARFDAAVLQKFAREYACGRTPNPCVDCNRHVKLGWLCQRAESQGFDIVVTGHYARTARDEATGRWLIKKGASEQKDQSYVLYALEQWALSLLRLPLGAMDKEQVRALAADFGFQNAHRSESQDICFVPDGDYAAFLRRYTGGNEPEGDFVDAAGQVLGRHRGISNYTVGQRRGLGVSHAHSLYVLGKDAASNTVTLGSDHDLYISELWAEAPNWISIAALTGERRVHARTRYHQREAPATIAPDGCERVHVRFDTPVRAPAPGQAVVFYDGDTVVGGGTIV